MDALNQKCVVRVGFGARAIVVVFTIVAVVDVVVLMCCLTGPIERKKQGKSSE